MYYLFAGDDYYPQGGKFDFRTYALTVEDARRHLDTLRDVNQSFDWWHITNGQMQVVASSMPSEVTHPNG